MSRCHSPTELPLSQVTVEVLDLKEEADKHVHRIKGVQGVRNDIEVAGPQIPDGELQQKLAKAISYDRIG